MGKMTERKTPEINRTDWLARLEVFAALDDDAKAVLRQLGTTTMVAGTVIFRPGDASIGFPVILSGRVGVYLVGPNGREVLLYAVDRGQSCVQSTLGLMGGADYTGEAIAETVTEVVLIPEIVFERLLATSDGFRRYVFGVFANRLQSIMHVLERITFVKVEQRLATELLERADQAGTGSGTGIIETTHQDLATAIGSAREVVSRRLEMFAKRGLVALERGHVTIDDPHALRRVAGLTRNVGD